MSSINTNLSAMTALQSLKATQTSLNKTQGQISTGLRVSEASHNASYWSIATQMKSDNGALGAVKDSIKQSKAMINTYTSAMDKTLTYLNKMKEGLVAASQPGADKQKIQTEFNANIEGMKSAANSAAFNGQNWLSGAAEVVKLVTSYDGNNNTVNTLSIDTSKTVLFEDPTKGTGGILEKAAAIDIGTLGTPAKGGHAELNTDSSTIFQQNDTISFKVGDGATQTFTVAASGSSSMNQVRDAINQAVSAGTLSGVKASIVDGNLRLESTDVTKTINKLSYNNADGGVTSGEIADVDGSTAVGTAPVAAGAAAAGYVELDMSALPKEAGKEVFTATFGATVDADTIDFDGVSVTLTAGQTATQNATAFAAAYNADSAANWVAVDNEDGTVSFTAKNGGTVADVAASDFAVTSAGAGADVTVGVAVNTQGTASLTSLAEGKLSIKVGEGDAQEITIGDGDNITDVNALKAKIDAAISDNSLLGVSTSVVDGKLRITSEDVTKGVAVEHTDTSATTQSVGTSADPVKASTVVADGLKAIDAAIAKVTEGSAMLGANKNLLETQEEFINTLSDSLTAGVSAFVDADMNEASTRLQALQTQQQLGVQALSIANQNSQMILKLFQ